MKKTIASFIKSKAIGSLGVCFALFPLSALSAVVVNIDFGNGTNTGTNIQTGLAAAPDAAGAAAVWNAFTGASPTATGLLDSMGNATGVGIDFDSRGSFSGPVDQEITAAAGVAALMSDYLTSRANDSGFDLRPNIISGLVPGDSYDLYIYGQGDNFHDTNNNGGQNVGIQVGSEVRQTSYDGTVGGDGLLVEDVEYVLFSGLIADASGEISFNAFNPGTGVGATDSQYFDSDTNTADLDGNASRFHAINGIQLVANVPEPSSTLLLGLSALGLFARRRR